MELKHNLETLREAYTGKTDGEFIHELFAFIEDLKQRKQLWLNSSDAHPYPNCKTCTVEWINAILGIVSDAEKEVEKKEGSKQ